MHSCPFCPKVITGRKRIANHLKIFHPNREVSRTLSSLSFFPLPPVGGQSVYLRLGFLSPLSLSLSQVTDLSALEVVVEQAMKCKQSFPTHELLQIKAEIKEKGVAACPHVVRPRLLITPLFPHTMAPMIELLLSRVFRAAVALSRAMVDSTITSPQQCYTPS